MDGARTPGATSASQRLAADGGSPTGGIDASDAEFALVVSEVALEGRATRPDPSVLRPTDTVLLVSEAQVFVWSGSHTLPYQRWAGWVLARAFADAMTPTEGFPPCRTVQGAEPAGFTALFSHWQLPYSLESQLISLNPHGKLAPEWPLSPEELDELTRPKAAPPIPKRELNVWQILNVDGNTTETIRLMPKSMQGIFRSDCCYMVLDTHVNPVTKRKQHILYFWMGEHADRMFFLMWRFQLSGQMAAQVPIMQEYVLEQHFEPEHFFAIFRRATSKSKPDKPPVDKPPALLFIDCPSDDSTASDEVKAMAESLTHGLDSFVGMLHAGGASERHASARHVPPHSSSLNSWGSFIVQLGGDLQLLWHGKGAKPFKRQLAQELGHQLRGRRRAIEIDEGAPTDELWQVLAGGPSCFLEQRLVTQLPIDPRLFRCAYVQGHWQVSELVGFGQNSLVSDHVYFFDAYNQVFLWLGKASRVCDQEMARKLAARFLESANDGRPPQMRSGFAPTEMREGEEPHDFRCYFHRWSEAKSTYGDPYTHPPACRAWATGDVWARGRHGLQRRRRPQGFPPGGPMDRRGRPAVVHGRHVTVESLEAVARRNPKRRRAEQRPQAAAPTARGRDRDHDEPRCRPPQAGALPRARQPPHARQDRVPDGRPRAAKPAAGAAPRGAPS